MSSILTAILILASTGFLLLGAAEFVARKAERPLRSRLLNWIMIGFLIVPIYIHGFHGNELISVASVAIFAAIGIVKVGIAIMRARNHT